MLAYVCLLAFIGLCSCTELQMPSREDIESSINRTIQEVEKMMEDDPSLPKLSRNDIVNILYNITSKDVGSLEDEALEAIRKTREDYQRALMVVLPYKPTDDGESLRELYTKPPIVHIVSDNLTELRKDSEIEFVHNPSHRTGNAFHPINLHDNKHQLITAHMKFDDSEKTAPYEERENINEDKTTTTTTTTTSTTTIRPITKLSNVDSTPQKFTFNLNVRNQRPEISHTSVATQRPISKGTFSRYRTSYKSPPGKVEIIYSSSTAKTVTTATPVVTKAIITAQNKSSNNILSSDQWHYNAPPATSTSKTMLKVDDSPWKPMEPSKGFFLPTIESQFDDSLVPNFADVKVEDFEKLMEPSSTKSATIFVTPSTPTNQKNNVINNLKNIPSGFELTTTTTTTTSVPTSTMRQEVEQLLKSIGLQPMKTIKQKNTSESHGKIVGDQKNESNFSIVKDLNVKIITTDPSKTKKNNSFIATPQTNVKNLSPDIQLLFQQFGLQIPNQDNITTTTTLRPTLATNVNSFTRFKPIPTSSVKDKDFRNFLARFGLGTGENRNKKAMESRQVTKRPPLLESMPNNMRKILENIGLIRKPLRIEKNIEEETKIKTDASKIVEESTPLPEHISKPQEGVVLVDDSMQKEKIKNLLTTVRMVQEGKADVQDVQKVAHELLQSTKTLANGPDPLKLEEILNSYRNSLKNEVKRQQEQTTTTATSTAKKLTESTLPSRTSTETSVSTSKSTKTNKTDQSSSSSTTDEKASKPSFFDSLLLSTVNKTENTTSTTAETLSTSESSTKSNNFFDNFNLNDYTTTEDSAKNSNVNLSDLEESFGGSTAEPDPILPTKPKTGFYFLVDWNSFLEVGEDGKDKVSLKFAPKVGDRTKFIPVKIP